MTSYFANVAYVLNSASSGCCAIDADLKSADSSIFTPGVVTSGAVATPSITTHYIKYLNFAAMSLDTTNNRTASDGRYLTAV